MFQLNSACAASRASLVLTLSTVNRLGVGVGMKGAKQAVRGQNQAVVIK